MVRWRATRAAGELRSVQERLDAEVLRAVADCDAVDAWNADCLDAVSWLASKTGLVRNAAARLVKTARFVARHPQTAKALDAGDVTVPHVEMLAAVAHRRDDLYDEHETVLLDAATTVEVQDFPQVTRRWASLADDELARREAGFAFERRGITLSPTTTGSAVSGFLDPEAAAIVGNVLDDLQPPEGAPTRAPRHSDAPMRWSCCANGLVVAICPHSRPIAGAEVVMSHDVFAGRALARAGRTSSARSRGSDRSRGSPPSGSLCDCALGRVVMQGRSQILDLGRRTRTVPDRLRRAVVLRDQHCQFPGCRAPASWCDATIWCSGPVAARPTWRTSRLLCRRHHVAVHEGGWKLARGPDGLTLAA